MATGRIRLLVDLQVHDGKFEEFEAIAKGWLASASRKRER